MEEVISGSEMEPEKRDSERRGEQQREDPNARLWCVRRVLFEFDGEKQRIVIWGTYRNLFILDLLSVSVYD